MSRCAALRNVRTQNLPEVVDEQPVRPFRCGNRLQNRLLRNEAILAQAAATRFDPFRPRNPFVQVPSQFNALTASQAAVFPYQRGFTNQLPTLANAERNGWTAGLGGTQSTINQVAVCYITNNVQRPANAPYRAPSVFNCLNTQCADGFCYSAGLNNSLPTIQQANLNKGTMNDWSGSGTQMFAGNLCIPITSFGPDNF